MHSELKYIKQSIPILCCKSLGIGEEADTYRVQNKRNDNCELFPNEFYGYGKDAPLYHNEAEAYDPQHQA